MAGLGMEAREGGGPKSLILILSVLSGDACDVLPSPSALKSSGDEAMYEATHPRPPKGTRTVHTASGSTAFLKAQGQAFHTLAEPQIMAMTPLGACSGGQSKQAQRKQRKTKGFDTYGCFQLGAGIKTEFPTSYPATGGNPSNLWAGGGVQLWGPYQRLCCCRDLDSNPGSYH